MGKGKGRDKERGDERMLSCSAFYFTDVYYHVGTACACEREAKQISIQKEANLPSLLSCPVLSSLLPSLPLLSPPVRPVLSSPPFPYPTSVAPERNQHCGGEAMHKGPKL